MSRLGPAFAAARGHTGLIPFITAGYPSLDGSLEMLRGFARLGVRAIEIGIPFSDPIADGAEIQCASEWALAHGVGREQVLDLVRAFRRESEVPVVVMTYANPILPGGAGAFAEAARAAGVDGVIISDLPPDEGPEIWEALDRAALDTVVLVAPTTEPGRLPLLLGRSRGFLYCLARTGVTGASAGFTQPIEKRMAELRGQTALPIAVGFGISKPDHARALVGIADAVVVGAALMRAVAEDPARGAAERAHALAAELVSALD